MIVIQKIIPASENTRELKVSELEPVNSNNDENYPSQCLLMRFQGNGLFNISKDFVVNDINRCLNDFYQDHQILKDIIDVPFSSENIPNITFKIPPTEYPIELTIFGV